MPLSIYGPGICIYLRRRQAGGRLVERRGGDGGGGPEGRQQPLQHGEHLVRVRVRVRVSGER